jgi:hypothetical protein
MSNSTPENAKPRNSLVSLSAAAHHGYDQRLSGFANVVVNADRSQGKPPRFRDGMTLEDAVVITGLPREEAARRIAEWKRDSNPDDYAAARLSEGAGERYLTEPKPAEVVQLAFWGEDYRAAPNAVFRSALFPALHPTKKEKRQFLKNEDIFCVAGLKIFFTGEQFDQSDLDVYLEILNMARPYPLGTPVKFSAHALLKALGISTGGREHAWLHEVLIRLCGGVVDATDHGKRYFGQLLHGGIRDELTMNYEITINPTFAILFGFGMFAKIDLAKRRALGRNNTAKALYGYYASHINPTAHNIETLANLAGLTNSNKRQTKAAIIKAHEAMKAAGCLLDFTVSGDSIKAEVNPNPSQARAIINQATQPKPRRRTAPIHAGDLLPQPPKGKK